MSAQKSLLFVFLAVLATAAVFADKLQKDQPSPFDIETAPITAYKRFYSWEDAKRAASIESEEGMRAKRKQFYAWAGKRSAAPVHFFEDAAAGPSMEKRKQFYAWAGK